MKDLFKSAYFGKPYQTRDGKKALLLAIHPSLLSPYIEDAHIELLIDNYPRSPTFTMCNSLGQCMDDYHPNESIVSEWKGQVSDGELNNLAEEAFKREIHNAHQAEANGECYGLDFESAYKLGFRDGENYDKRRN